MAENNKITEDDILEAISGASTSNDEPKKEEKENDNITDINIESLDDIVAILYKKKYDFVTFEPSDNDVKLDFRKDKVIVETKLIKYPIYSKILLKAKQLSNLSIDITDTEQVGNSEGEISGKNFKISTKVVPSNFGEKLFFKATEIEKNLSKKEDNKVSLGQILSFIGIAFVVALIIGGSFLAFIVLNAQTVEDVRFFAGLGISLNEINAFIARVVTIVFSLFVMIETIVLIICLFKFFLTKKELRKRKYTYGILSVLLLIITFVTATFWISIDRTIKELPNWQEMSLGEIQLYDNDKFINNSFSQEGALLTDTTNLIGPINIRFDLSYLAMGEERRGMTIERYEWNFGDGTTTETLVPTTIKNYSTKGAFITSVKLVGKDYTGKDLEVSVESIPSINISYSVDITERILSTGGKQVTFDATTLRELGQISWYNINNLETPLYTGNRYISTPLFEDNIFIMHINNPSGEIDKLFIISGDSEIMIDGKISYERSPNNDLEVNFRVTDILNAEGTGFIEEYIWKIGNAEYTRVGNITNTEASSEVKHTFTSYGEYDINVELINSAGESKIISERIDLPKVLRITTPINIYADEELLGDVTYNNNLNEYFINELGVPSSMKFDGRNIRVDSTLYTLDEISWDSDNDGNVDYRGETLELPINSPGDYTVTANISFNDRRNPEGEKTIIIQKIFIEAIRKEYDIDFQIKADSEYAPVIVSFDGSKSNVADSNIVRFTWDYGDGIVEDRDAVVPGHRYVEAGDYVIKLTVTTENGKSYSTEKTLILKPLPQSAKISTSVNRAPIGQGINFSSSKSEGQIANYFWDFGDGNISTGANPTHKYEKIGKYSVSLRLEFTNKNILSESIVVEIY